MPNALLNLAGARLGLGSFTSAATLVDQACSEEPLDAFVRANALGLRIRIALSRRDYAALDHVLAEPDVDFLRPHILGEDSRAKR